MRHKKNSAEKLLGKDLLPSFCEGSHIGEELSSPPPSLPFKDVIRWFVAAAAILRPWGETLLTHYGWQLRKREPGNLNYCTKPCIYILPNFSQILSVHIVFEKLSFAYSTISSWKHPTYFYSESPISCPDLRASLSSFRSLFITQTINNNTALRITFEILTSF